MAKRTFSINVVLMKTIILPFSELSMKDLATTGGKNASLGEMIGNLSPLGISVPDGFAVTADAFWDFMAFNTASPLIQTALNRLERSTLSNLSSVAEQSRKIIEQTSFPQDMETAIQEAYDKLSGGDDHFPVAVRSSATAEDSPTASFAGQHDSFLNVCGADQVIVAVRRCYVSLFNDRAIKYRMDHGFMDMQVGMSVGIQSMVRSDLASAGVMFSIEPETGNRNLVYITGSWGLGESVVQGAVNTDEFMLFKPALEAQKNAIVSRTLGSKANMLVFAEQGSTSPVAWKDTVPALRDQFILNDDELTLLGRWAVSIEEHYGMPMDIEWAKDGISGKLFIVQARPETVQAHTKKTFLKEYTITETAIPVLSGKAVGMGIVSGPVRIIKTLGDSAKVNEGDIIVADITNPDWNALLRKAISIVTNKGGRTSHASIVARELGIPAVVGTIHATEKLVDGQTITVSCANGDEGLVYPKQLLWEEKEVLLKTIPSTKTKPMLILADPSKALMAATYPNQGIGLLRMEFIVSNTIQIHPMALANFDTMPEGTEKNQIAALTRHYSNKKDFFVEKLAESIGLVAAAFYPKPVIVRMSDFKTNEYARLIGGKFFEPTEENPMLGFRGASRYYHERYQKGFELECNAITKLRQEMGLDNIKVMIPFCRTIEEARKVLAVMAANGLERKKDGLEIYVMAEIPSNILLADQFAGLFDGFSIGSNDLTQLTLGLDRDSEIVSHLFNESDESVQSLIRKLVQVAHEYGVPVGLCGQAPSDHPEFAAFLVQCGIDSISFNTDALIRGIQNIAEAEKNITEVEGIETY
jgi:pyruvate,water dikinase